MFPHPYNFDKQSERSKELINLTNIFLHCVGVEERELLCMNSKCFCKSKLNIVFKILFNLNIDSSFKQIYLQNCFEKEKFKKSLFN